MTKPEAIEAFLSMYEQLTTMAQRRLGDLGADAVNQAYVLALENGTYKHLPRSQVDGRRFWVWKVKKQVSLLQKREKKQQLLKEQRSPLGEQQSLKGHGPCEDDQLTNEGDE